MAEAAQGATIHTGQLVLPKIDPEGGGPIHHQMVCGHLIHCAPGLQGTHWSCHDVGKRHNNEHLHHKEGERAKFSSGGELGRADDALPQAIWSKYFIEAQGYKMKDNIMYQDNKSSILLETNGKFSSSKRT